MNQERFEQRIKEKCPIRCLRQIYLISKGSFGTIFSNDLSPKEKIRLLNERKDMPAGTHFRKELDTMCNLSYGIEERGIKKGIEQGIEQGVKQERLNIVKNMLLQHMPVEDIKKYSGATDEEILKVDESLCAK